MCKKMNNISKIIVGISLTILAVTIYFMYIYYYYKEITIETFINHTVGSMNLLARYIRLLIGRLMENSSAVNIILVTPLLILMEKKINISDIIKSLRNIEVGSFKAELEGVREVQQEHENNAQKIKCEIEKSSDKNQPQEKSKSREMEECLENEKKKGEILQLILDNPSLVNVIERFLSNSRGYTIPINLIGIKYNIKSISQLFDYEIKNNSVKIKSIKNDIELILIDVYTDLRSRGLIYSDNI